MLIIYNTNALNTCLIDVNKENMWRTYMSYIIISCQFVSRDYTCMFKLGEFPIYSVGIMQVLKKTNKNNIQHYVTYDDEDKKNHFLLSFMISRKIPIFIYIFIITI